MQATKRIVNGKDSIYFLAELLGQGQFGKVYRAHQNKSDDSVAIKIIRRNKFMKNQKLKNLLQRQMNILSQFNHENVIRLLEVIVQKQDVFIVYEFCDGGTLEEKIPVPEEKLMNICVQIIDAMLEAENKFIIHRDLKPANILFKDGKVKIADWGFSRLLENGQTTCSFLGSPAYMAPQALKGEDYTQKADIWSLGVVLYESLTGVFPWKSSNIGSLAHQIKNNKITFPKEANVSTFWQKIIIEMLCLSPNRRPSCRQLKQKFMQNKNIAKNPQNIDQPQQEKIMSCVFFLQIVQWSRKHIERSQQFQMCIKLIEQNLLRLRSETSSEHQVMHILQKEIKVVSSLRRKIQQKALNKQKSLTNLSLSSSLKLKDDDQNPQGLWEQLVKNTVKYVIDSLELIYQDRDAGKKEQRLIKLNVFLDLIVFTDISKEYLQKSFENYLLQLATYHKKILLKLINYKLQLINKRYYQ